MGVPDIQFHQKQSDYLPYQLQKQNKVSKVNSSTEKGMFGRPDRPITLLVDCSSVTFR